MDKETHLIRPGLLAPPPVCLTWATSSGERGIVHAKDEAFRERIEWYLRASVITTANGPFDLAVAGAHFPDLIPAIFKAYDESRIWDVQLSQKMLDNAIGRLGGYVDANERKVEWNYSLGDLSMRFLGKDRTEQKTGVNAWRMRYHELADVPIEQWPKEAIDYAMEDSDDTLAMHLLQAKQDPRYLRDAPAQCRKAWSLHLMSCWGVRTNETRIRAYQTICDKRYDELTDILVKEGLLRPQKTMKRTGRVQIETRDTKAAAARMEAIFKARGEEPPRTDKGAISLDHDACEDAYDKVSEFARPDEEESVLEMYAERTALTTVVKSHIPALLKGTRYPIQPRFEPFLASGRTSCKGPDSYKNKPKTYCLKQGKECILDGEESRRCIVCGEFGVTGYGFQLQNPRRKGEVRSCFEARPGHVFIDCDFSGLELCTVGEVLINVVGWSRLADAMNTGLDPHLMLAAQMLGISYEEALSRKHEPLIKNTRNGAKPGNFGAPGGIGAKKLVEYTRSNYGIRLAPTFEEAVAKAKELKANWLATWPEFREFFRLASAACQDTFAPETETLYTGLIRGMCTYTEWCNFSFQSLGAAVAGRALYAVTRACYAVEKSPLYGARPWNFVHDQILTEVREEVAHEAACEQARIMVEAGNVLLPNVPVRCAPAISKRWNKDTEGVYDAPGGRLVPYDIAKEEKRRVFDAEGKEFKWAV